ncbi:MAG TPA: 50S ribosomal protein L24 [Thermomicrobiales bacterium]|nr:50S ribosomal protein L24 [Thermomicrobiales bacterium]
MASKILSGDEIIVLRGKNKGARGRVRQNMPREEKVVIEGVNIVRKHLKRGRARQAGIIEVEAPMHASKVMLICPSCDEATRVGFREDQHGNKERFCKKCDATIARANR